MALKVRNDILPFATGIKTEELFPASQLLTEIIGVGVQPNKAIVGKNAFAHEAGIHQDGYLKDRTTYEIMEPTSVGVPSSQLVVGKHSGRHAIADRCTHLGYTLSSTQLESIYHRVISMCDKKKWLSDQEIGDIARSVVQS
jgi:2-isopropylmalate synthase